MSAVNTTVAYNPYPVRIALQRCAASRIGYEKTPLAAVYVLSARKGSETPQSPFGSSNDWELCKSRHTWERWQDSSFRSPAVMCCCSIRHVSFHNRHWHMAD